MAIDYYCGPLSRYYSHHWKNSGQQAAEEMGAKYHAIRIGAKDYDDTPWKAEDIPPLIEVITTWRSLLYDGLKENLPPEVQLNDVFDWEERIDKEYFTQRIDLDHSLAASARLEYLEKDLTPSESLRKASESLFPVRQTTTSKSIWKKLFGKKKEDETIPSEPQRKQYIQTTLDFWLPADFDFSFESITFAEERKEFGSSYALLRELEKASKTLWNCHPEELPAWTVERTDSLEINAKAGIKTIYWVAKYSVENRMPIILDY
jgi:hypothetical protein